MGRQSCAATTLTAQELADLAADLQARGNCGVAFTYTEPLMLYEFVRDAAPLIRERGLVTVLVTNGFIGAQPWQELLEHIDAVNIDLKAYSGDFYRKHCQGRLEPVQQAIALAKGKCHLEITTLLVAGHNTEASEIRALSAFIADLTPTSPCTCPATIPPIAGGSRPPTPTWSGGWPRWPGSSSTLSIQAISRIPGRLRLAAPIAARS